MKLPMGLGCEPVNWTPLRSSSGTRAVSSTCGGRVASNSCWPFGRLVNAAHIRRGDRDALHPTLIDEAQEL